MNAARKVHIFKSPVGIFAFSSGELLAFEAFPKNEKAADEFLKPVPEDFIKRLGGSEIIADNSMKVNIRNYARSLGLFSDDVEFNEFMNRFCAALSYKMMSGRIGKDRFVVQAFHALDEIDRALNMFTERVYEWYSLHYPETGATKKEITELIVKHRTREGFPKFRESVGMELDEKDEKIIVQYAETIKNLKETRNGIEHYIKDVMNEIAPNFSSLVEPLIAARLLSYAGSLEKMAKMSSSTIQLLGAEKALFMHLKNKRKVKSPKFGIIFLSSHVQNARDDERGKVARVLASKLALAIKIDFYSGRDERDKMKRELDNEIRKVTQ